jgi:hypothetical protein
MENHANVPANNVSTDVNDNLEPDSADVTASLRHLAMDGDLKSLVGLIASNRNFQDSLARDVAACREKISRTQAATGLSVTCTPGAGQLLKLKAMVDAELARRAIECIALS